MIVIKTWKENSPFKGIINAVNFEDCIKQLNYYFVDMNKVKREILEGKIIHTPFIMLQRDRRVNQEQNISNERRLHLLEAS